MSRMPARPRKEAVRTFCSLVAAAALGRRADTAGGGSDTVRSRAAAAAAAAAVIRAPQIDQNRTGANPVG